eukprot:640909-Hanusia_phi.AAC.1
MQVQGGPQPQACRARQLAMLCPCAGSTTPPSWTDRTHGYGTVCPHCQAVRFPGERPGISVLREGQRQVGAPPARHGPFEDAPVPHYG